MRGELPEVVLTTTVSVDGRITLGRDQLLLDPTVGGRWSTMAVDGAFADRHAQLDAQAILEGSGSFATSDAPAPTWPTPTVADDVLWQDHLPERAERWFVVADGRGRVDWSFTSDGITKLHVLVCRSTPPGYLQRLRDLGVGYFVVGDDRVDLRTALARIRARLGVTPAWRTCPEGTGQPWRGQGRWDSGTICRASSSSTPATTSRSTTIERTCPRIISADSPAPGSTRADSPATRSSTRRAADGRGVLVEHAREVLGGVGQRLDEVDVVRRHGLPPRHRHRGPAGEHPQVAHAVVQRHHQRGCRLGGRAVAAQQRRLPHHGDPLGGGGAQLGQLALQRAGAVERLRRQHPVAAPQGGHDIAQRRGDLAHGAGGLGPRPADR